MSAVIAKKGTESTLTSALENANAEAIKILGDKKDSKKKK